MSADSVAPSTASSRRPKKVSGQAAPDAGDEAQQVLISTVEALFQIAGEYAAIHSDDLTATLEAGTRNANLFTEISQSYLEVCASNGQTLSEIARDAMACRTTADILNVQTRALEEVNTSIGRSSKLWLGFVETWYAGLDPLVARLSDAPQRLFRAVAD